MAPTNGKLLGKSRWPPAYWVLAAALGWICLQVRCHWAALDVSSLEREENSNNSCACTAVRCAVGLSNLRHEHCQVLVFGGFSGRVQRGATALAADQHVQTQLAGLVEENSELRRMYKHMETQLTFAAEELSGTQPLVPLVRSLTHNFPVPRSHVAASKLRASTQQEACAGTVMRTSLTCGMLLQREASSRTILSRQCKPHVRSCTSHLTPRTVTYSSAAVPKVNITVDCVQSSVSLLAGPYIRPATKTAGAWPKRPTRRTTLPRW